MTAVIATHDLGRWYGDVVGLADLTCEVGGGITGLLGPNGAGKSTFLRLVAGELRPSRGRLEVLGRDPFANRGLYARLGFAPQQDALYDDMSGRDFVTTLLRLGGFSRTEARARADRALERVGLTDAATRRTRGYSKGMRQRVKLAQAIAHDPELIVVDEPLSGLDPLGRRAMLDLFRELADDGAHVLISSHVLHEVESLTSEVLLLHRGRLLAQGAVPEIRALLSRHPRRVTLEAREPRRLARALLAEGPVTSVAIEEDRLTVETFDVGRFFEVLPAICARERAGVRNLTSTDAGLEAVFDYLIA